MSNFAKFNLDLEFAIKHNKNVVLIGEKGVGKTQIIKKLFNTHFKKWKYYSTPTMDQIGRASCRERVYVLV